MCVDTLCSYPVLLVVVAVVNYHEAQVEAFAQIKEVVRLRFGPAVVMEIQLILLLRVHRHLYCLEQRKGVENVIVKCILKQTSVKLYCIHVAILCVNVS